MPYCLHSPTRSGWGFSLDEAARIHNALMLHWDAPRCPRCRGELLITRSTPGSDEMDLVRCEACNASMIVNFPLAAREPALTSAR